VFNEDASKLIRDMIYAFCLSRLFYGILNGATGSRFHLPKMPLLLLMRCKLSMAMKGSITNVAR
jgi:hypothetical protein